MGTEVIKGVLVKGQIVDVRIKPDGGEENRVRDTSDSLVMTTEDGDHVELSLDHGTQIVSPFQRQGRFGDLLDDPLCVAVIEHAPGDHVEVELEGVVLEVGAELTVLGVVERGVPQDYRGESEARPVGVQVECVAAGHHDMLTPPEQKSATRTLTLPEPATQEPEQSPPAERPKPKPPGLGLPLVLLLAGICGIAAGLLGMMPELPILPWVAGLPLSALGLYGLRRRRSLPQWLEIGKRHEGEGMDGAIGPLGAAVVGLVAFGSFGAFMSDASETDAIVGAMAVGAALLIPAALGGLILFRDYIHATRIWRFLRAPRLTTLDRPSFGYLIGTLAEGTLERRREFTLTETSREVWVQGSNGQMERRTEGGSSNSWVETGKASRRVIVQSELGDVEVSAGDAHFGSLRREWERMNEQLAGHNTSTSSASRTKHSALLQRAQPGDTVLVIGRPREGAMRATGPESLALFAAPPGEEPRPHLRRHVLAHFALVATLFALSAVGLALQSGLLNGS